MRRAGGEEVVRKIPSDFISYRPGFWCIPGGLLLAFIFFYWAIVFQLLTCWQKVPFIRFPLYVQHVILRKCLWGGVGLIAWSDLIGRTVLGPWDFHHAARDQVWPIDSASWSTVFITNSTENHPDKLFSNCSLNAHPLPNWMSAFLDCCNLPLGFN